jgi:hypothetical protein
MNVIAFVINEMKQIQGDIILSKAMVAQYDDMIEEAFQKGDILQELIAIKDGAEAKEKFSLKLQYLEGKIDAYITLLKQLGIDFSEL